MTNKKALGVLVVALFLLATAGAASAASIDLPKWVIVPEDSTFSDTALFCGLDAMDTTNNVTPCFLNGAPVNATIYFNSTTGYPKLVSGRIGNAFEFGFSYNYVLYTLNKNTTIVDIVFDTKVVQYPSTGANFILKVNLYSAGSLVGTIYLAFDANGIYLEGGINSVFKSYKYVTTDTEWHMYRLKIYTDSANIYADIYKDTTFVASLTWSGTFDNVYQLLIGAAMVKSYTAYADIDEVRLYTRELSDDEIKLLYLAGRKKLSEPANFRQIFSPMIDLTRDRATFYAGLEVSTSDPNGYVPVPESAVNMSITSAPRLKSDYTNADFYYQGHYWYQAQKIQFNLPIQFETIRESGGFSKEILLDEDKKTFVYEKEFKVTNPTAARLNVVYSVDPTALGFSVLQFPQFELDGINMVSWQPQNSTELKLIRTDTLEPGEISTHWIKSIWTISKEELEFPAKLEDFRNILDWQTAQKLAENAAKGKSDTYVKVIKIDSNADVSNVTVLVPLKDVEDESDVVEAVALTGSRETLQVEKLEDGKIVVKVPADAFVSGHAEIKVLYNKETSWWKSILDKIRSLMKKILSMFGLGGG